MNSQESGTEDSPFVFPCSFPIKVFGPAVPEFRERVLALIREHAPDVDEHAVRENLSRGGRYLSMTVTIEAKDRGQLDAIYRSLTACELVTMAL